MKGEKPDAATKRGYLKGDFEYFHLKDNKNLQFEFHHHEFDKIVVFISGKVTYLIEGTAYRLKPWDFLLVSSSELHKPIIEQGGVYERIVIWLNPLFLEKHNSPDFNLSDCFDVAAVRGCNLLRPDPGLLGTLRSILMQLEEACKSREPGGRILKNSLVLQLMVHLNRLVYRSERGNATADVEYDETIGAILSHINDHLEDDLSIENLSSKFFMSRYYLMHRFKLQTGYSIHNYILQKRLIQAGSLISKGRQAREVCAECGFLDYSSFVRAFRRMYGKSPRNYYAELLQNSRSYSGGAHILD